MSARQVALTALAFAAPLGASGAAVTPVTAPGADAHFKITSAAAEGPGKVMCVDSQTVSFVLKSCQLDGDDCIPNEGQTMSLGTVSVDCSDATEQRFGIPDQEVSFRHNPNENTRYIVRATNKENGRFIESAPFQPGATSADAAVVQMKGNDMQNPPLEVWNQPDLQKAYQFLSEDCGPDATAPLYYTDWLQDPDGKAKLSISPGPKPTQQQLLDAYNGHCNTETALHTAHTVNGERDSAWVSITDDISSAKSDFDGKKDAADSAVAAFSIWENTESVKDLQAAELAAKSTADTKQGELDTAKGDVESTTDYYKNIREHFETLKTNFAPYYETYLIMKGKYDAAVQARAAKATEVSQAITAAEGVVATKQGLLITAKLNFRTASDTVTTKLGDKNTAETAYNDAKPATGYNEFCEALDDYGTVPFTHTDPPAEVPQPTITEPQANQNLQAARSAYDEYMEPFPSGRRRLGASSADALAALSGGRRLEEAISPCTHDICGRQLNSGPDPAEVASLQDAITSAEAVVNDWIAYNNYVRDRTERAIVAAYNNFDSARQEYNDAVAAAAGLETAKKNAETALSTAEAALTQAQTTGANTMSAEDGKVNTAYANWDNAYKNAYSYSGGAYQEFGPRMVNGEVTDYTRLMLAMTNIHNAAESAISSAESLTRDEFNARLAYGIAAAAAHTEEKRVHDAALQEAKDKVASALGDAASLQTQIETALVTQIKTFEENLVAPSGALSLYWTDELDLRAKHGEVETAEESLKTKQVELQNTEYGENDVAESELTEANRPTYTPPELAALPTGWRPPCQSEDPVPEGCPQIMEDPANLI